MSALSSMAMDGVKRVPGGAFGKVVETGEGRPGTLERYLAYAVPFTICNTSQTSKAGTVRGSVAALSSSSYLAAGCH